MIRFIQLLSALAIALIPLTARANWPQWRGPGGQGYANDVRVPLEWGPDKNLLWKTKLPGPGHSTPIIWGQRAFLTCASASGDKRWVVCIDTENGKILWEKVAASGFVEKTHATSTHASPSCVTDGERVFAFFGTPGLFCYDFDGNKLWERRFGIFTSETNWGVGASPALYENLVIVNCDNDGPRFLPRGSAEKDAAPASLVALDKATGQVVWQTPRDQGRGFSTPVLISTPSGRIDLVLNGPLGVWGYDPKTGHERWHCDRYHGTDENKFGEPLPLFTKDMLYTAAGRERGYLQAIKLDGAGSMTPAWEVRRTGIRDVGSGVLAGNYLIYADGRKATISAHDINTGKMLFQEPTKAPPGSGFYASPILLNGKVLCLRQDGRTFVIEPGPKLKVVRENLLSDGTDFSASPAVADGKLFLRSQTHLYCIGSK